MPDALLRIGTRAVAACVFLLLIAGALVTSTQSGLAVPDWPLSYGKVMPPMVGGILFEHGHRLIAAAVSTLVGIEFGGIFFLERKRERKERTEKREKGPRRVTLTTLAGAAFGAILLQAVLGGLTVIFLLPPAVSSAHAALAEIVFALTVVIALMCSKTLADLASLDGHSPLSVPFKENLSSSPYSPPLPFAESSSSLSLALRWTMLATAAIYVQIVLGAVMRHTGAGLAIPDFPGVFGGLWPSPGEWSRPGVPIHLAHRIGAVLVVVLVARAAFLLGRAADVHPFFGALAALWTGLLGVQILLGAASVWSGKAVTLTVAHLGGGALCWITGVVASVCLGACRNRPNAISSAHRA